MNIKKSILLRKVVLWVNYLKYKYEYMGKVRFRGFTYIYASKGSSINFIGAGTVINNQTASNMFGIYSPTSFYAVGGAKLP